MTESPDPVERARAVLAAARRPIALTGAGVSAESGVPTFRGPGGLWRRHRPEDLATPEAFARDPRLVWEWYAWRREIVRGCRPNAAHRALARWARGRAVTLVTQNVDGLHAEAAREAGSPPPIELHGSLFRTRCTGCDARRAARAPLDLSAALPACAECGALLRPDVVWFGEPLDDGLLARAFRAAASADACLVVGTSAIVHPAASVAVASLRAGAALVEVNPEPTPLSAHAAVALRRPAADVVPGILA